MATPAGVAPAVAVALAADAGGEVNPPAVPAGVAPKVGPGEAKEKLTPLVAVLVAAAAVGVWTGPGVVAGAGAAAAADVPVPAVVEEGVVPKLNPLPPPVPGAAVAPAAGVRLSQSAGWGKQARKVTTAAIAQKSMVAGCCEVLAMRWPKK